MQTAVSLALILAAKLLQISKFCNIHFAFLSFFARFLPIQTIFSHSTRSFFHSLHTPIFNLHFNGWTLSSNGTTPLSNGIKQPSNCRTPPSNGKTTPSNGKTLPSIRHSSWVNSFTTPLPFPVFEPFLSCF